MLTEISGFVAIWIGNIKDAQSVLNDYIFTESEDDEEPLNKFAGDMDEFTYDEDLLGGYTSKKPLPLKKLISKMGDMEAIVDDVVEAAEKQGLTQGTVVIRLLDHKFTDVKWPKSSPVLFIGNFKWEYWG